MEVHLREIARVAGTLPLAVSLFLGGAQAQEFGGWTPEKLAGATARLQSLPPEERIVRLTEVMTQYALDQVWALSSGRRGGDFAEPTVKVHRSGLPVFVERGTLSVPVQFFPQATALGLMVGHDAALAAGSDMSVAAPLLFRPFAEGRLLSIVPDAGSLFEVGKDLRVFGLAMMATCNPQAVDCRRAQGIATLCSAIFVVGHEVGHLQERHSLRSGGAYPVQEEMLADARGLETLKKYLRNLQSSGQANGDIDTNACLASPVAFFELNSRRLSAKRVKEDYLRRRDALLDALGSSKGDVASLVDAGTDVSGIGSVKVAWSGAPSLVLLDGVAVDRGDVEGMALVAGRHRLVGLGATGVGVVAFRVSHGQSAHVQFAFQPFEPAGQADLATMVKARRWADVLAATSDSALRPRDSSVAVAHWTALRGLRLAAWIHPEDFGKVAAADARRARAWRASGLPLYGWDSSLANEVE